MSSPLPSFSARVETSWPGSEKMQKYLPPATGSCSSAFCNRVLPAGYPELEGGTPAPGKGYRQARRAPRQGNRANGAGAQAVFTEEPFWKHPTD